MAVSPRRPAARAHTAAAAQTSATASDRLLLPRNPLSSAFVQPLLDKMALKEKLGGWRVGSSSGTSLWHQRSLCFATQWSISPSPPAVGLPAHHAAIPFTLRGQDLHRPQRRLKLLLLTAVLVTQRNEKLAQSNSICLGSTYMKKKYRGNKRRTFIGFTILGRNNHIAVHLSPMMVHLCYQGLSGRRNKLCFSGGVQCETEREADIVHVSTSP